MPDAPPPEPKRPEGARPAGAPIRAFLAIPADPAWAESAQDLVRSIAPLSPPASWTRPPAWHLTIKFLGNATREALESFARAVAPVAAASRPGSLASGGPVIFPARGPARVLGIGFSPAGALPEVAAIASAAEAEARHLGLEKESRAFSPHVTLARLRSPWPAQAVARFRDQAAAWKFPDWPARACVLYASRLGPGGAAHTALVEMPFGGAAA